MIVVGKERDLLARHHAKAVQIRQGRRGEHNARAVVVVKGNGALQSAGGQNGLTRYDTPKTLARQMRGSGHMQSHPFKGGVGALVIGANHSGARHQPHIGQAAQFGQGGVNPRHPKGAAVRQQAAPHHSVLLGQDHIRPRTRGGKRGDQASRARANHQKIAKGEGLFIRRSFILRLQPAKACSTADQRFVKPFPKSARPHEGFVIKSRA